MTTQKTPQKAKHQLSNIDFTKDSAHIALVSKEQGHGANGHHYALVMKSNGFSQEAIQKMQQIQVTMDLPDFLRKFFSLYYDDSEVLARLMGYVPEEVEDDDIYGSEAYYAERLESFTVMKSLHESGDILKALSLLNETEYLALLNDQVELEKAFEALPKESDKSTSVDESENSTNASVEKSVGASGSKIIKSKKDKMTQKIVGDTPNTELVEKSAVELIQKSLDEAQVELQKARDTIQAFEAAAKEQVVKAKTDKVTAVLKDEKLHSAIVKAALSLESDDDFSAFLAAIQSMAQTVETTQEFVEKSALFVEQGASTSDDTAQDNPTARILKSKYQKAK